MGQRAPVGPGPPEPWCPEGLGELLAGAPADLGAQRWHGWNPADCSHNIQVQEGGLVFERRPVARTTDGVRGKRGYWRGLHAWEICWPPAQRGTHAMVGVATARAPLRVDRYAPLLGSDQESWGWDITRGHLYHRAEAARYPAAPGVAAVPAEVPERLLVVLDMEEGTLGYAVGGTYLGPAFRGLGGRTLYPAVSAVWGQCRVRIRYLGERRVKPHSLLHLSRLSVRNILGEERLGQVATLPLPPALKRYLLYQ
ncbi:SPRY domain-containing SOCS box protein 2 [Tachyglossus aculeatus]|uniref:SPRY domain-containing SOCS box protein 2 n=1 Tax=Tachyglossus aculeatus TaxID=9261 RepID=UPI0018F74C62|nr:SPRY domain-containing SOCS box protein 2 [Tachyglossus aculeatus]